MIKLSQPQRELLTQAAEAQGGAIAAPAGAHRTIASVIKCGLLISVPQTDGPSQLLITQAGRVAVGAPGDPQALKHDDAPDQAAPQAPHASAASAAPRGKVGAVVHLLRRPEGISLEALMAATGWQAHSVRGVLSGSVKKKLGLPVSSEKIDGVRIYRIAEAS